MFHFPVQVWNVTGVAYGNNVSFTDGTTELFTRRERPHLIWDAPTTGVGVRTPVALSNGVQYGGHAANQPFTDATLTLIQPLNIL